MTKAATAGELIEFLKTLPPDTQVEVLREYTSGYNTCTEWVPLNLGEYSPNVWSANIGGTVFLQLGER